MTEEEEPQPQTEEVMGQPAYGPPDNQSLAVIKYTSENDPFEYADGHYGDPEAVIEGDLPPRMKSYFWAFLNKDSVLGHIRGERDLQWIMNQLENSIDTYQMTHRLSWDDLRQFENLRNLVRIKFLRAMGGFERKQQSTQISQNLVGPTQESAEQPRSRWSVLGMGGR